MQKPGLYDTPGSILKTSYQQAAELMAKTKFRASTAGKRQPIAIYNLPFAP